jgi:glycosidase
VDAAERQQRLDRMGVRLHFLYGDRAPALVERLRLMIGRYGVGAAVDSGAPDGATSGWSERDVALITYGDMVHAEGQPPLATLGGFLRHRLADRVRMLHVLPFFPYSSDDGFSVKDYRVVDPALGSWADISMLAQDYRLMADLVINHVSRQSEWVREYVNGVAPYRDYFVEVAEGTDLSAVVRPRPHPLLTAISTRSGQRWLWATFSADQLDLNFANPDVLFDLIDVLMGYIARGVQVIRLDAIAFLWKEVGTSCLHLTQTHEVVKLLRDWLELVAPHVWLLTETNVPHEENISYFGAGDEAHMVYQFSLPPLLAHGLLTGSAATLTRWAASLPALPEGCTFFNFTASHDGVGVRPLQGLVDDAALQQLVEHVRRVGGAVSMRSQPDGSESPYELNVTYFDVFADLSGAVSEGQVARFLSSQAIMLALQGVPAVYFNSLFGARNHVAGMEASGQARRINRQKWELGELEALLNDPARHHGRVLAAYLHLLDVRRRQPAFHPDAAQRVHAGDERLFCIERRAIGGGQVILSVTNFSEQPLAVPPHHGGGWHDLISGQRWPVQGKNRKLLQPWQTVWLTKGQASAG